MIIGISGYIGSGKDTVGKMIQYLHAKSKQERDKELAPLLFLPDFKYPSFEDWCKPKMHTSGYDVGFSSMYEIHSENWQIKKFAGKLKQIASILTGIPHKRFEDQEFKNTFLENEWNSFETPEDVLLWAEGAPMTVRTFLQKLGTEAIRDGLHQNAWVNALFADYNPPISWDRSDIKKEYPNWIITDTRFPNEAEAIKARGGIVVRVDRKKKGVENQQTVQLHASEIGLDDWKFDYVINNNGTLEELQEAVKTLLINMEN